MRNPHYDKLVQELKELHDKKNSDYAVDGNPFSNFQFAAQVAEGFTGVHVVFASLIGVKLARMSVLLKGKSPNNESLSDTFRDLANYCLIWASYYERQVEIVNDFIRKNPLEEKPEWEKTTETTSSGLTVGDTEIQELNYSYAVKLLDLMRSVSNLSQGLLSAPQAEWSRKQLEKLDAELMTLIEQMSLSITHQIQTSNDGKKPDTPSQNVYPNYTQK